MVSSQSGYNLPRGSPMPYKKDIGNFEKNNVRRGAKILFSGCGLKCFLLTVAL